MKLGGLLLDNLGLKILAIGMAWAVWFMVSQGLSDDKPVPLQLDVRVDDESAVRATLLDPTGNPAIVTITVAGPVRSVADFQRVSAGTKAVIQVGPQHHPQDMEKQAVFRLEDLKIPDLADFPGLRVTEMEPNEIRVNVERMEVQDKPVMRPECRDRYGSLDVRVVNWDTVVKIRASAKHLPKQLATIRTSVDDKVLGQLANSIGEEAFISEEVALTVDPIQAGLFQLVDRDRINVRIELRQTETGTFPVPVHIYQQVDGTDPRLRHLRFSPGNALDDRLKDIFVPGENGAAPMLNLVLEGSPATIAAVDPEAIKAFVMADEMPEGELIAFLPVHVAGLPGGVRLKQPIALTVEGDR